jgi:ABC-type multidrug transport system permease subunit
MRVFKSSQPQLNPIVVKELRSRMRGFRPYAILTIFLVVLVAVGYGIFQVVAQQARFGTAVLSAQMGQALFTGLSLCTLFMVVFLAPALTSGAISGEREHLTYDMLVTTPLRPARILWGKLIATLSYLFLLLCAAIPVFSLVLMFGGVTPTMMFKALTLILVATITYGTIGLFCSTLFARTASATVVSYILVFLIIGGTMLAGTVWSQFTMPPGRQVPPQVLYLNPFSALMSIIAITPGGGKGAFFGFGGDFFSSLPLLYLLSPGVVYYGPNGPEIIPLYRATLMFYPLLTLILAWISSHLVLPRKRWRLTWGDLRFVLLLVVLLTAIWLTRGWWFVPPPLLQ